MSKKAFEKIKGGLDEALVIAPYVAEIERIRAENAKLRAALKPFACKHLGFQAHCDDGLVVPVSVELGYLRAAAAALKETGE